MGDQTVRTVAAQATPGLYGARPARTDVDTHADPFYPYIRRSIDDELARSLDRRADGTDRRPLVLAGPAMSGTSRMIAEALRVHPVLGDWTVLVPPPGADPADVLAQAPPEGAIIWWDNIDDTTVDWGSATLSAWRDRDRLLVAAAVRTELVDTLIEDRDFHSPWSVLADVEGVEVLRLPLWRPEDLPAVGVDPLLRRRIVEGRSLGQALGGAVELEEHVRDAGSVAEAVVRVVTDWARMGLRDGIPTQVAEQVWLPTVGRRRRQQLGEENAHDRRERFERAVAAMAEPIPAVGARPIGWEGDRLYPDSFLVAHPPSGWATIGDQLWSAALVHASATGDPRVLLVLGLRAYAAEMLDVARGAWEAVARMKSPLSGWGWALVGQLHAVEDEEPDDAMAALWNAMDSGHPDAAPAAAIALGRVLEIRDPDAARRAYAWAVARGHSGLAPEAALRTGWLLEWDDPAAAREAYETAIRSGHAGIAPEAAVYLAWMLEQQDTAAARQAYCYAVDSGHPDWAPKAAADLGWMLSVSDPGGARAAYERALASGHEEWAPRAAVRLGQLLSGTDPRGATTAYRVAAESQHGEWSPMASVQLARLLVDEDPMAACAALRAAIASEHQEYAPVAEMLYGEWCAGPGTSARRRHWSRAATSDNPRVLVDLACVCLTGGEPELGRRALRRAADAGSAYAEDYLHVLDLDATALPADPAFARVRGAAEAGDPVSMNILGLIAVSWGEPGAARNWWSRAAADEDLVAWILLRRYM